MSITPGTRVRLVNDPGRVGVCTDRRTERAGRPFVQVTFPERTDWIPLDQLEAVDEHGESPIDLLRRGRLARPSDLYRALTHIRLAGRLANFIYSLETTNTDFYAYQFKPVLKLLQSVSTGILVADEVGLGKTIEAGLIWTELRSRFDLSRLLVLCPAMLREKWAKELRRFGLRPEVLDAEGLLGRLEDMERGGLSDYAIVASVQGLRPGPDWQEPGRGGPRGALARLLAAHENAEPLIDLLVIDEAHYLRNPDTRSHELGRVLRRASQFAVLLSATPVHLRSEDLFHLLQIVDEDAFPDPQQFEWIRDANQDLVQARDAVLGNRVDESQLSIQLQRALARKILKGNRQLEALVADLDGGLSLQPTANRVAVAARLEVANLLGFAVSRTRRREVKEFRAVRDAQTLTVEMTDLERRFYLAVTDKVRDYCTRRDAHEGFLLVMPQRQMASCMAAAHLAWRQGNEDDPESIDDLGFELPEAEVRALGPLTTELSAEVSRLGDLSALARHDTKYERLRAQLRTYLAEHPREKVVLFSTFRTTLRYLANRLRADDISVGLLLGGDPEQEAVLERFRHPDGPSVLLSSEVGSEGIDLQFSWVLINYDLPWNPMKVEQRIGRLDRLGQTSPKVAIWNLLHADTIDERIHGRLLARIGVFERTLGGLEIVVGPKLAELTADLMRKRLTPDEEAVRIDQTAWALEQVRQSEEALEREAASLTAYGDLILQRIDDARNLSRRIRSEDIQRYVCDYLSVHYPGCRLTGDPGDPSRVAIDLSVDARRELAAFSRDRRAETVLAARAGAVWCRFDNHLGGARPGADEVITQVHPLTRFVTHTAERQQQLERPAVAGRIDRASAPAGVEPGDYRFVVTKWNFDALRPLEQLWFGVESIAPGGRALGDEEAERLLMALIEKGDDWPGAADRHDCSALAADLEQGLLVTASQRFDDYANQVKAENADRADAQLRSVEAHYKQQRRKHDDLLRRFQDAGNPGLARAQELLIEKLEARVRLQRSTIEAKRVPRESADEISVGVIRVE